MSADSTVNPPKTLDAYIHAFSSALAEEDWPALATLQQCLLTVVESAKQAVHTEPEEMQFQSQLSKLHGLVTQAATAVAASRDATAQQLKTASTGRQAIAEYSAWSNKK